MSSYPVGTSFREPLSTYREPAGMITTRAEVDERPPRLISLEEFVDVQDRIGFLGVLDDGIAADNSARVALTSRGANVYSTTGGVAFSSDKRHLGVSHNEDVSASFHRVGSFPSFKAGLRGQRLQLHADLGQHAVAIRPYGIPQSIWLNPYVALDTTKDLDKLSVNVGLVSGWRLAGIKCHKQLAMYKEFGRLQVDGACKTDVRFNNYFLHALLAASMLDPAVTTRREFLAGLDQGDLTAGLGLRKNTPGSWLEWRSSSVGAVAAYRLSQGDVVGLQTWYDLASNDRPKTTVAYQRRLARDLFFRAKVNCSFKVHAYTEVALDEGVALQTAVSADLQKLDDTHGFLGLPIGLGLKLVIDR